MTKKGENSNRKEKESKIEEFAERDIITVPAGVKSNEGLVFEFNVNGEIRTLNEQSAVVQLERKYDTAFVTYNLSDLKKHSDPKSYREANS